MERVVLNCQSEEGAQVDVTDEQLVLVHVERTDKDLIYARVRCPLCDTIEMHPVDTNDPDFDIEIEFATGPYTDIEHVRVTRDPLIFSIERTQGHFSGVRAAQMAGAIRNLENGDDFINLTVRDEEAN